MTHSTMSPAPKGAYVIRPSYVRSDGWRPYERQYSGYRTPITLADLPTAVANFTATFGGES